MANLYRKAAFCIQTKALLLSVLLGLSFTASATELLPYSAKYHADIDGWEATLERSLVHNAESDKWLLTNKASILFAGFEERSSFLFDQNIIPISYQYNNKLSKKRNKSILFDWSQLKANTRKGKTDSQLTIPDPSYDLLSYQVQLRLDVLRNKDYEREVYTIVDAGRFKEYSIELLGEEWLETPAGKFETLKLEQTRKDKDRRTLIWLAKNWQYMIVKLQRFEGDSSDQLIELKSATMGGKTVKPLAE